MTTMTFDFNPPTNQQTMKPIENITIKEAIAIAESETKDAQTRQVASAIKDVMFKLVNARLKLARSEAEVAANAKSVSGLEGQFEKIKTGDWSAIPDLKEEKEDKSKDGK